MNNNMLEKSVFIELTNKCNLSCNYCNKNSGDNFIEIGLFENIIKQLVYDHIKNIRLLCLWGGEPLLHPEFGNILKIIQKYLVNINKKFDIIINTNGILLKGKIDILNKLIKSLPNINFIIYVSLDGLGVNGNFNRGINKKQYDILIESIESINEKIRLGNFKIIVSSVLGLEKTSLLELSEFIDFFEKKSIKINFCFQEMLGGNNIKISINMFSNLLERYFFLIKKGYKVVIESNIDLNNVIRINSIGKIYNFIDESFIGSNNFLIGTKGDLSFLYKNDWYKKLNNFDIWNIIYINKGYITLIDKLFNKYY